MWGGVGGGGPARFRQSVQWFPDIFCQWPFWHVTEFHRLPFSFEPKFPSLLCSTPASMRDTHSKHSSFLKSRLWQLWDYSFTFHCLFCSPSEIPTEPPLKIMRLIYSDSSSPRKMLSAFHDNSWRIAEVLWPSESPWNGNSPVDAYWWRQWPLNLLGQEDHLCSVMHAANCSLA